LLAGGCSELSLAAGDTDLEMDYYDYNVSNAGAVPGSFLGMDPQYLIWIPPFAPGQWEEDGEVLEMVARSQHQSASDSDDLTEFIPKAQNGQESIRSEHKLTSGTDDITEFIPRDQHKVNNRYTKYTTGSRHQLASDTEETTEVIPLTSRRQDIESKEMVRNKRYVGRDSNLATKRQNRPGEKETRVEKSLNDDDIKFADDEDDEEDEKLGRGIIIMADNKQQQSVKRT
jgi:hypothetical protein